MAMADKMKKLMEARGQGAPQKALVRSPIMVLAATEETEPAPAPPPASVPTITVFEPKPVPKPEPAREVVPEVRTEAPAETPAAAEPTVIPPPPPEAEPEPERAPVRVAKVAPRRSAEQMGTTMSKLMAGLSARGVSRRNQRVSIPYSVRLDSELFQVLREGEGSAASKVLKAFLAVPRDDLDAIAGGALVISERRRRPSRGGLGQSGTVTVNLDGPGSETLEVLAKRSRLSCAAYLEGCVLIWALNQGFLKPEDLS